MINMRDLDLRLNGRSLSGLPERWELLSFLDRLTMQSQAAQKKFTTVLIRLEPRNKSDSRHHKFDQELLQYSTSTLRLTLRDGSCHLFQYGSDEFMGVFPDTDKKDVAGILSAINKNFVRRPFLFRNRLHSVQVKIGVSSFPKDGWQKEDLLRTAAASCARARLNTYRLFSWMDTFRISRVKPVLTGLGCMVMGALLFFAWSRLGAGTAFTSTAAKMAVGTSVPSGEQLVKVVTKSGAVFQGFLISETGRDMSVSVIMDGGQATVSFSRAEIAEVLRGKNAL